MDGVFRTVARKKVRALLKGRRSVSVFVCLDGEHYAEVRVSKKEILKALVRSKAKVKEVRCEEVFGQLCIG